MKALWVFLGALGTRFKRDQFGAIAIAFALSLAMLVICIGAGVDFSRVTSTKTKLQNRLDNAVLAAVTGPYDERIPTAARFLNGDLRDYHASAPDVTWENLADGTFVGQATSLVDMSFTRFFGVNQVTVRARSAAAPPATPSIVTFNLQRVKGWFWKRVTVWVHEPNAAADTLVATITYQPTNLYNGGSGTVYMQLPGETAPGVLLNLGQESRQVVLGNTYDSGYLKMEVSPDGCAPGFRPQYPSAINSGDYTKWNPYTCLTETSSNRKTAVMYTLRTDDPATANHLFVDGKQLDANSTLTVLNIFRCGQRVQHAWEDTQYYIPSNSENRDAWADQDFTFTVDTPVCEINQNYNSGVRLVQ